MSYKPERADRPDDRYPDDRYEETDHEREYEADRLDTSPAVRYLASRCGDRKRAEDIVQDALETMLRSDSLRKDWRNLGLLFRVALNEFNNQQRINAARSAHLVSVPGEDLRLLPENRGFDIDLAIDVRNALGRLPSEPRRLILLYWQGYSYAEIAEKLDLTRDTVRMRLMRAKRRFVEELAEYRGRGM